MFDKLTSGDIDTQAIGDAAADHVTDADPAELQNHLETAASNLEQSGQSDLAQQASGFIEQLKSNPEGAKAAIVSFIQTNPQVLQHFNPGFAQGILSKLGL